MIVAGLNRPENHEIECAFETLIKAEEIKQNKDLLDEVFKYAESKKKAIKSIADIKAAYDKKVKEGDNDGKSEEEIQKSEEVKNSEETPYIDRVEQAREEANAPSEIEMVKVVEDDE